MPYQADDVNEPWHDVDAEQLGNQQLYGVIGGCDLTYSGSTMAVTMGAGTILVNGVVKQVASDGTGVTLVADGSNKRWSIIGLTSTGVMALSSGTAAASSSVEASKPELGTIVVPLAMVKIEAAQTIASNIAVKLDKRVPITSFAIRKVADETVNNSATLQDDNELLFYADASTAWHLQAMFFTNSGATPDVRLALSLPSGGTATGIRSSAAVTSFGYIADGTTAYQVDGTGAEAASWWNYSVLLSSTAGNVKVQFAQWTQDASNTVMKAGSIINVRRAG